MNGQPPEPVYSLAFDPRALNDLLAAPGDVRDVALSRLQDAVTGRRHGQELTGTLAGFRKIYLDSARWRMVYGLRPAPEGASHRSEVFVVALRPRAQYEIYKVVADRLGIAHRPLSALAHAARSRSPQAIAHPFRAPGLPGLPGALPPSPVLRHPRGATP
ncbi:hypothetical protein OTB20_41845 [Streptomyces sp. H27-H1]|uniref:hypothetical protein n=1 Tax=Streptomyces sp. H27-H1 TaxID=2996461 RepID=UPI00226E5CC3|nr:hypothetical protein [Streptomyces sp. H27-H1]MCY0932555.1 hypothetical protein [Streptomyces sp. H27-H1]